MKTLKDTIKQAVIEWAILKVVNYISDPVHMDNALELLESVVPKKDYPHINHLLVSKLKLILRSHTAITALDEHTHGLTEYNPIAAQYAHCFPKSRPGETSAP